MLKGCGVFGCSLSFFPWLRACLMSKMKVATSKQMIYRFSETASCLVVNLWKAKQVLIDGSKVWLFPVLEEWCKRSGSQSPCEKFCFWKWAEMQNGAIFETSGSIGYWNTHDGESGGGRLSCCSAKLGQTASDFSRLADFPSTTYSSSVPLYNRPGVLKRFWPRTTLAWVCNCSSQNLSWYHINTI